MTTSDFLDVLPVLAMLGAFAGVATLALWRRAKTRRAFIAAFARDPDFVAEEMVGDRNQVRLRTRAGSLLRQVDLDALGGGKNDTVRWEARAMLPSVACRTTLKISPEGMLGPLRETLGMHDIHVGDPRIDDLLKIEGSDAGVVRALFSNGPVQSAALALFARDRAMTLVVDDVAAAIIRVPRNGLSPEEARLRMRHALALFDALDHAANLKALPDAALDDIVEPLDAEQKRVARALDDHGVGAESGAPIGIPLVGGKR